MSRDAAFLADIIARPDDDAVRLIYADWLDENDDPYRAEFIRAQVELAGWNDPVRFEALEERAEELREQHQRQWLGELADVIGDEEHCVPDWKRGFVEGLVCFGKDGARQFIRHAPRFFALTPLRRVDFVPMIGEVRSAQPWEGMRSHVDRLGLDELRDFVQLKGLERLTALGLGDEDEVGNMIGDAGASMIASCKRLRGLRELLLAKNGIEDWGALELVEAKHLQHLSLLDLQRNPISEIGRRALINAFVDRVRL